MLVKYVAVLRFNVVCDYEILQFVFVLRTAELESSE